MRKLLLVLVCLLLLSNIAESQIPRKRLRGNYQSRMQRIGEVSYLGSAGISSYFGDLKQSIDLWAKPSVGAGVQYRFANIEYIIIDGLSTDGTVELVQSYGNRIHKFISEKDSGLYDAINKGICIASGDVVGLLHSDDLFYSTDAISQVAQAFEDKNVESVYGDLHYVHKENTWKIIRNWRSGTYERERFRRGWMPPHPTFYVKRSVYMAYGLYDTEFKSAADYELMLRYLYKHGISTHYIQATLVKMRVGGESNRSLLNRLRANREDYIAWKKNNLAPKFYTRFLKPLRKLRQFTSF